MMKWRPWPPLVSRKYEVRLIVRRLEGCDLVRECPEKGVCEVKKLTVEVRWKGPKLTLSSLRRTAVVRNLTREVGVDAVDQNGVVEWDEEFRSLCNLSAYKDNVFHPWEIAFTVFSVSLFFSPMFFSSQSSLLSTFPYKICSLSCGLIKCSKFLKGFKYFLNSDENSYRSNKNRRILVLWIVLLGR